MIAAEVNAFTWPGPDYLPPNTFVRLRDRIAQLGRERRLRTVERS